MLFERGKMGKTIQEILSTPTRDALYLPLDAGNYLLFVDEVEVREARERRDGSMGVPSVHTRLRVVGGDYDNRVMFHTFWIDVEDRGFGFVKAAYHRITGNDIAEALTSDVPTNEEVAEAFAEGIRGGKLLARVGVRKNRDTGESVNFVARWLDEA